MSWPEYPDYKIVGIPWLERIPSSWEVRKFRYCFSESNEKNGAKPVGKMLSVSGYRGVEVKQYDDENKRRTPDELEEYRVVRVGQLAVNTMWLNYAGLGVSEYEGHISPAYRSYWISPGFDNRFVHHLMRSSAYVDGYTALLTGVRPNSLQMSRDELMSFPILSPPVSEQRAIARFLDSETAKIDALIGKHEQLIAVLREDRTATITHAVTKGLDPDVEMKDSGVAGLDRLPSSWTVKPFVRCVENQVDYRGATPRKVSDGVTLVTARNVRPGWIDYEASTEFVAVEDYDTIMRRGLPRIDDLLLTMEAPLGNVALVDRTDIALAQRIIKFRADPRGVIAKFLLYSMMGAWFQSQLLARATGSTALGLKASKLPELRIAVPRLKEQAQIVKFLDERCTRIDALITKADEVIETLREYRSALITDAVTGKIDVRKTS